MTEEAKGRRRRRRPRRRPEKGAAAAAGTPAEGDTAARPRSGSKRRSQTRKRSPAQGREPRKTRRSLNWWTRRWSDSLAVVRVGGRLRRGRIYARQGRVIELEFEKGSATAMVQGSRDAPYLVRMVFARLSAPDWKRVLQALGEDAELGGGLFLGEFPERAEEAFTSLGLSLFPSRQGDLKVACSCPDEASPCKHVAAVYYALGEEIDRDPFLLLRLRGLDRTELMEALANTPAARAALPAPPRAQLEARGDARRREASRGEPDAFAESESQPREVPLPTDPQLFWAGPPGARPAERGEDVRIPAVSGALIQRLGGAPFWQGETSFIAAMARIYSASSLVGLSIVLGESEPEGTEER